MAECLTQWTLEKSEEISGEGFECGRLVEKIWMVLLANVEACHQSIEETHEV